VIIGVGARACRFGITCFFRKTIPFERLPYIVSAARRFTPKTRFLCRRLTNFNDLKVGGHTWRNMALAVWVSHRVISDYLECLWKNASPTSHALFAGNLCAWTNARSTISGNPCMNHALLNASKKRLREAKQRLDGRKYDANNIDLLDMW